MANAPLHSESAQAKLSPGLFATLAEFEETADQVTALLYTLAEAREIDPMHAKAIQGAARLAGKLSGDIADCRELMSEVMAAPNKSV